MATAAPIDSPGAQVRKRARTFSEGELRHQTTPLYKFVLTGGPCAGKTTALSRLRDYLGERGFRVFTVPEAATMLFSNGAAFTDLGKEGMELAFQLAVIRTQMHLEDTFADIARGTGEPSVLLCDRGTMDGSAYVDREKVWLPVLDTLGQDEVTLRDGRYNAVLHLVTAAIGAEKHYTLENNQTRTESPSEAAQLDARTMTAWAGHPQHCIFENAASTDFEGKLQRVVERVGSLVGLAATKRHTRKFALRRLPTWTRAGVTSGGDGQSWPDGLRVQEFDIEKVYLHTPPCPRSQGTESSALALGSDDGSYTFVRRRAITGQSKAVYQQTTVHVSKGQRIETKRMLTSRDYGYAVAQRADPTRHVVVQRRLTFLWEDSSYTVTQYLSPSHVAGFAVLHCNAVKGGTDEDSSAELKLPPFLAIGEELADDGPKSAYIISLKQQC